MILSKAMFGNMLADKMSETSDLVTLSRWAYKIFLDYQREMEPSLRDILQDLMRMEDASEFEYTVEELRNLAIQLQRTETLNNK